MNTASDLPGRFREQVAQGAIRDGNAVTDRGRGRARLTAGLEAHVLQEYRLGKVSGLNIAGVMKPLPPTTAAGGFVLRAGWRVMSALRGVRPGLDLGLESSGVSSERISSSKNWGARRWSLQFDVDTALPATKTVYFGSNLRNALTPSRSRSRSAKRNSWPQAKRTKVKQRNQTGVGAIRRSSFPLWFHRACPRTMPFGAGAGWHPPAGALAHSNQTKRNVSLMAANQERVLCDICHQRPRYRSGSDRTGVRRRSTSANLIMPGCRHKISVRPGKTCLVAACSATTCSATSSARTYLAPPANHSETDTAPEYPDVAVVVEFMNPVIRLLRRSSVPHLA
jgi:hypothetical protein